MVSEEKLDDISRLMSAVVTQGNVRQDNTHYRWFVMFGLLLLTFGFIFNRYDIQHEPSRADLLEMNAAIMAMDARLSAVENRVTAISLIRRNVDGCKALVEMIAKEVVQIRQELGNHVRVDN